VPLTRELVEDLAAWAGEWLGHRQRTLRVPGLQFAIAHEGTIVASGAHGMADLGAGEALTTRHAFHIASHSKTFTATAILQLAETDPPSLRLDDPLVGYLPASCAGLSQLAGLTITDLLHHGSGMTRDGADGDYWQLRRPFPNPNELLDLLERSPSPYPANDRFHYSNIAYSLLGRVIEQAAGCSYGEFVRRSIIDRLGLVDTAPDFDPRASDRNFAMGYTSAEGGRERVPIEHLAANAMAPATGFTSTARDLCLYFSAHCVGDRRILSDDAKRRMQHGWWAPRTQEQYGLGLQIIDIGTRRLIGHSGGYPGHTTRTWCDPKDQLVISVLCNASDAAATPLCNGIFHLLEHLSHPDDRVPSHADAVDLRSFTGHFNTLSGAHDIASFGTRLLAIPTDNDDPTEVLGELVAEDPDTALLVRAHDGYTSEGERFHFARDATGKVLSVCAFSGMTAYPDDEYVRRFLAGGRVRLLSGEATEAAGYTAGSAGGPSTVDEDRLTSDK
jgi:D-alanyl-D-alanine carboxypeptidase